MLRDAKFDKVKNPAQLKKDIGKKCCIDGCGKSVTNMEGPGMEVLCRQHQLLLREYGGPGRIDRPHTFHRRWVCSHCGKDVCAELTKKYPTLEATDPKLFNRLLRNRVIGDHIIRKADGGDDSEENLQSLCLDCNADKTTINEDYKPSINKQSVKEIEND